MRTSIRSKAVLVLAVSFVMPACGASLSHRIEDKALARTTDAERAKLDSKIESQRQVTVALKEATTEARRAKQAVAVAESKVEAGDGKLTHAVQRLKQAKELNNLPMVAEAENHLAIARAELDEAKGEEGFAEARLDFANASLAVAQKRATLAAAEIELENAQIAGKDDPKVKVSKFHSQVAKSQEMVADAEADATKERHEMELAKGKLEVNQAELKKTMLRFAPKEAAAKSPAS